MTPEFAKTTLQDRSQLGRNERCKGDIRAYMSVGGERWDFSDRGKILVAL